MASGEDKNEASQSGASAVGGSKLFVILMILNMFATLGMVAILLVSFSKERKSSSLDEISANVTAEEGKSANVHDGGKSADRKGSDGKDGSGKKSDFGKMVGLEQFTVNLSTPGSVNPKFVRVNVSLEVMTEDLENEVNSKMPQVRNVIIDLFTSKRPADLADYIKEEIKNALNNFIVNGKVRGVFFTNFAVSS
jgi:flagellar protein FliL